MAPAISPLPRLRRREREIARRAIAGCVGGAAHCETAKQLHGTEATQQHYVCIAVSSHGPHSGAVR